MTTQNQSKPLGIFSLTSLVAGTMIGSGIFLLPAQLAKIGTISLLSWIITTLGAIFLGIVLAKLSILVPKSGGPYAYARAGFGDFIGFQTAYTHWIALWVSVIGLSIAMVSYLANFFPILSQQIPAIITAIIIIWLLTFINISGVKSVGVLQIVTTILKIIPILLIILFGFTHFTFANISINITPNNSTYSLISSAAGVTLWSFIGIEAATIPYNYIDNPRRNIPRATIYGILIATLLYILSSVIIMGAIPANILSSGTISPFILFAQMLFGDFGKWLMIGGAIISCFGCMNGLIFSQSQVMLAAAEDNLLPEVFRQKNQADVPSYNLIITAFLQTIILLSAIHQNSKEVFNTIVLMASLAALIPYLYASAASLLIFKKQAKIASSIKKYLPFAFLAAIYSFWIIMISGKEAILQGSLLIFVGVILYALINDL